MAFEKIKLEPRSDNEPKFNKNNKTDRRILGFVIVSTIILTALIVGCFFLYFALKK